MKITAVGVLAVRFPVEGRADPVTAAVVRLQTDDGLEGLGHAIPFTDLHVRSLGVAMEELGALLIGEDPRQPERLHRKLMPGGTGFGGIDNMATAELDVGVCDLAAKSAGVPLYRALGGYRNRVPAYVSLRLPRTLTIAALRETAAALAARGFRAMKMNLGGQPPGVPPSIEAEVERVQAVRETIGPDVHLLADVNSRWTAADAIRVGRALEQFGLYWLEDPVPIHDLEGLAEVRRALDTPLATGESLFALTAFRPLFAARAVDIPMPDLVRVGGITPFLKIAHLAEAFDLPVACHLLPEISAQVVAAVPNGQIVEYIPWAWGLFQGGPTLADGELVMSEQPGHGLTLDADFLKQHAVR